MTRCAFAAWWWLPLEQRRRLRVLPTYMLRPARLAHLTDGAPKCAVCRAAEEAA